MEGRSLHNVPDDELLARLADLLRLSRSTESDLVAHIAEVDERRLYAREAFPSMFAYCTEALHLSEAEAYLRIAAARASREHPLLLDMLADGRLHLSGVGKLAPHITRENAPALLARAAHRTKRQIEARHGLEFHHRRPFGLGGDHSVDNISLLCAAHNHQLAEVDYGREAMARHRRARKSRLEPRTSSP
jgi:hypothetical protein